MPPPPLPLPLFRGGPSVSGASGTRTRSSSTPAHASPEITPVASIDVSAPPSAQGGAPAAHPENVGGAGGGSRGDEVIGTTGGTQADAAAPAAAAPAAAAASAAAAAAASAVIPPPSPVLARTSSSAPSTPSSTSLVPAAATVAAITAAGGAVPFPPRHTFRPTVVCHFETTVHALALVRFDSAPVPAFAALTPHPRLAAGAGAAGTPGSTPTLTVPPSASSLSGGSPRRQSRRSGAGRHREAPPSSNDAPLSSQTRRRSPHPAHRHRRVGSLNGRWEVWSGTTDVLMVWDSRGRLLKQISGAHSGIVTSILQVDTETVWSAGWDGAVTAWSSRRHNDYEMQHAILAPAPPKEFRPMTCLRALFFPAGDGSAVPAIAGCGLHTLRVWSLRGEVLKAFYLGADLGASDLLPTALAVPRSSEIVCVSVKQSLLVFSASLESPPIIVPTKERISCLQFVLRYLWVGDHAGDVTVWHVETSKLVRAIDRAHDGAVFSIEFVCGVNSSGEPDEVWTAGKDAAVRLWDYCTFLCLAEFRTALEDPVVSLLFVEQTPDVSRTWVGSHALWVWSLEKVNPANLAFAVYENGDKYVGESSGGEGTAVRHGRGELHCHDGEIYVGSWSADERRGFGVATYPNKDKHYGQWKHGKRHGRGVLVCHDGSLFEGKWKSGERRGLGRLQFPNGDVIAGHWDADTKLSRCTYTKGDTASVSTAARSLFERASRFGVQHDSSDASLRGRAPPYPSSRRRVLVPFSKWGGYFAPECLKLFERELRDLLGPRHVPQLRDVGLLLLDRSCLLGACVEEFAYIFNASYHVSYGDEEVQLANALDDTHSFVRQLSEAVLALLPSLKVRAIVDAACTAVLSKTFDTLFGLFRRANESRDALFAVKLHSLQGITLETIGVKPKLRFPPLPRQTLPYEPAIVHLRGLAAAKTVLQKMRCLMEASTAILCCVDAHSQLSPADAPGEPIALGAEDKLPVFIFCLIKGRIPHLYAEVCFLSEFADSFLLPEESSYRLVELEQSISYVESLDWNVYDCENVLISVSMLENRVVEALANGKREFFERAKRFPPVLWIAQIFLAIGSRRHDKYDDLDLGAAEYGSHLDSAESVALLRGILECAGLELRVARSATPPPQLPPPQLPPGTVEVLERLEAAIAEFQQSDPTEEQGAALDISACERLLGLCREISASARCREGADRPVEGDGATADGSAAAEGATAGADERLVAVVESTRALVEAAWLLSRESGDNDTTQCQPFGTAAEAALRRVRALSGGDGHADDVSTADAAAAAGCRSESYAVRFIHRYPQYVYTRLSSVIDHKSS